MGCKKVTTVLPTVHCSLLELQTSTVQQLEFDFLDHFTPKIVRDDLMTSDLTPTSIGEQPRKDLA